MTIGSLAKGMGMSNKEDVMHQRLISWNNNRSTNVVHDRSDDTTPYLESRRAAEQYEPVRLQTTEGLGNKRVLADPAVVRLVVDYLKAPEEDAPASVERHNVR